MRETPPRSPPSWGPTPANGLTDAEATHGWPPTVRTRSPTEKPPSIVAVALGQLRDPMNLMLVAVTVVSLVIGQVSTGVIVGLLIVLNVVLGSRQELKARASVDALAKLQVPQARVVRDGHWQLVPATDIVPGDMIQVEAGDIVPADGRILRSATLETQEAALTGESAPIAKDAEALARRRRARATRPTCCSRTPRSPGAPGPWSSPRPACRPRWVRSPPC